MWKRRCFGLSRTNNPRLAEALQAERGLSEGPRDLVCLGARYGALGRGLETCERPTPALHEVESVQRTPHRFFWKGSRLQADRLAFFHSRTYSSRNWALQ